MNAPRLASIAVLVLVASIFSAGPAHAYIDPGSGSYFFQMLVAGLLGAGMAVKLFWRRIRSFFSRSAPDEVPSGARGAAGDRRDVSTD